LTEAGAALVIEAEATVRQFESAQRNAQRAGRGDIGHIELGYVASAVYSGLLQKQVQGLPANTRMSASMCVKAPWPVCRT
jgi:DNA-binding transcriptional LysR family regulator